MDALEKLSAASYALSQAKSLDDVKRIMDIAEAAKTYIRAARLGREAANHAAEVKLRAERKAGELLQQLEQKRGVRYDLQPADSLSAGSEYRQALQDTEVNERTARRWQMLADLPADVFEQFMADTLDDDEKVLTSALMLRKAQEVNRAKRAAQMVNNPEMPSSKYRIWYADPPWEYGNAGVIGETDNYGHAMRHYPTMSIEELCAMGPDIKAASDDNAVLFMWVTSPLLEECFPVIRAWGFKYKTSFVWDKVGHNYGHYNSVRHELLLVCTRGSCTPDEKTLFDSVLSIEKTRKHSEKPEEFRRMIDSLYTWGNRIELFARHTVDGWDIWGNEALC